MKTRETWIAAGIAGAMLIAAAGAKFGQSSGFLPHDSGGRLFQVMLGLMVLYYANLIPKKAGRFRSMEGARRAQTAARLSGYAFAIAGLIYTGVAAFGVSGLADTASMIIMASATGLSLGALVWAHGGHGPAEPSS
jgi:hypothetical protein